MIAVTGATGQLGFAFRRLLGDDALFLTRSDIDLLDIDGLRDSLRDIRPGVLINCAAYTAVDRAETEPAIAAAVNTVAVGAMADVMAELDARFVTFSTDYVFPGTLDRPYVESDAPDPVNVYGATKRDGELAALAAHPESLVIRTSWVLSGTHRNFASTMIRLAGEKQTFSVVDDQHGHPTLVDELARSTLSALDAQATGILHLTNSGVASWFSLAREILTYAGLDADRVEPCSTAEYPTPARRPANSVLDSERLEPVGLTPLGDYHQPLERAVAGILSRMP